MTARRLRVVAVPLLLLTLTGLFSLPAPQQALAQPVALPLTLTVTRLSPTAPQPGDLLTVSGTLTNPTSTVYPGLTVRLRIARTPLLSRSDLLAVAADTDHVPSDPAGDPQEIDYLAPGATDTYLLQVPVDDLDLSTAGVYRMSVEVAQTEHGDPVYDARVNTFLPWIPPAASLTRLQVAWVWPLLGTPSIGPDNTFFDDSLATDIAPRGRLGLLLSVAGEAVAQHGNVRPERVPQAPGNPQPPESMPGVPPTPVKVRPVPVTPVIDPETVQELELMADPAKPYAVAVPGSARTVPGTHAADASAYLSDLRALMQKTSAIAVPYADPDIEALARVGASSLVTQARSTGLEASLPNVVSGLVWPPDGTLSEGVLDQLTTSGLVLSEAGLPATTDPGYTPGATTSVSRPGGTVPAVVIDPGLTALAVKTVSAASKTLLVQRFAAETAAIALEPAPAPRTVVLAPPRRWSSKHTAVRSLLDETGQLPWLEPVTVSQALQRDLPDAAVVRGPLHQPPGSPTLPAGQPLRIKAANAELDGFRSILCPIQAKAGAGKASAPAPADTVVCTPTDPVLSQVLTLQRSIYRTASTAYRAPDGAVGVALLNATVNDVRSLEGKVNIASMGAPLNLVGHEARVPITIMNRLSVPVRVKLVLHSPSPALRTGLPELVTIPAGGSPQIDVTVRTERSGAFRLTVDAQLLTPAGQPLGTPVQLQVKVSAYGAVVVWITVAVCGLLGLAVVVRIYRRIRNARRGVLPDPEPQPQL